jgi:hypothetical protein
VASGVGLMIVVPKIWGASAAAERNGTAARH